MGWTDFVAPTVTAPFTAAREGGLSTPHVDPLGMKKNRDEDNKNKRIAEEDVAKAEEHRKQMEALGQSEIGAFRSGVAYLDERSKLTAGQTATLEKYEQDTTAKARNFMASLGLDESTMMQSLEKNVARDVVITGDAMQTQNRATAWNEAETHYQNAMQAFGIAQSDMSMIMQAHDRERMIEEASRQEKMQAFSELVTVAATIAGYAVAGPVGGMVAGGVTRSMTPATGGGGGSSDPNPGNITPYKIPSVEPTFFE